MEKEEQIIRIKEFISEYYLNTLNENVRVGKYYITIDFTKLMEFDFKLAEIMEEDAEEFTKSVDFAIKQLDPSNITVEKYKEFGVYIKNVPERRKLKITSKRIYDFKKLICFEGIIRAKTDVIARINVAIFRCPSCSNEIPVVQNEMKFIEPSKCGCGRRGKFPCVDKKRSDIQRMQLEELPENIPGLAQPLKLKVELYDGLVDPDFEIKFNPGSRVSVTGYLKESPVSLRNGTKANDEEFILHALNIENIEDEEVDLEITEEDKENIELISMSPNTIDKLKKSLAPSIYGHDLIKEGLLLQLVSGVKKKTKDGDKKRGDIHILMIGDPGAGKSALLQRVSKLIPSARMANGKGASGAGLTAATVKDEFLGGWTVQAGTLVLAHKTIAIIDELDKMSKDDRDSMHEALEQQTVSISKASVQATLSCETSLLAGANPKYGKFDPYAKTIAEQIDLPPTLMNRFDLIFPVQDIPDEKKDTNIGDTIFDTHEDKVSDRADINTTLLRKYLLTAKNYKPHFEKKARELLINYFVSIRNRSKNNESKQAPISSRQLEGLIRLAEAYAKLRLSKKVDISDATNAINIMQACLEKIAFDPETKTFDTQKIETGFTNTDLVRISKIKEWMRDLSKEKGNSIDINDIIDKGKTEGVPEDQMENLIKHMKKKGDIFSARPGYLMLSKW